MVGAWSSATKASADFATQMTNTGRGSVWLERLNGVQEVTGSSPVAPTNYKGIFRKINFL